MCVSPSLRSVPGYPALACLIFLLVFLQSGSPPIVRAQTKRKPKTSSPKTAQKTVVPPQVPLLSQQEQALFDEINYARQSYGVHKIPRTVQGLLQGKARATP